MTEVVLRPLQGAAMVGDGIKKKHGVRYGHISAARFEHSRVFTVSEVSNS